jgi:hypothetical protein
MRCPTVQHLKAANARLDKNLKAIEEEQIPVAHHAPLEIGSGKARTTEPA